MSTTSIACYPDADGSKDGEGNGAEAYYQPGITLVVSFREHRGLLVWFVMSSLVSVLCG